MLLLNDARKGGMLILGGYLFLGGSIIEAHATEPVRQYT